PKFPSLQQLKAFSNLATDVRRDAAERPVNRSLIFTNDLDISLFILFNDGKSQATVEVSNNSSGAAP
ncbi:hypothetical protein, partial [Pseudomonas syringae]|uniref:hypothetical protein n=1 Tax=Pseudomonas syringae TaxID=317 RepID=UPI001F15F260